MAINIIISNSGGKPIYDQIYTQIKGLIVSGELKAGEPLPMSLKEKALFIR